MNQWLHTNDILSCPACCFWGTVFSHWWGHLKLGHRFHAPTKVCSDHCPFKPCICIICRHRLVAWSIRIRCWTRVARGSNHHLTRTRDSRRILWTSWRLWGLKTSASGSFPSCTIASVEFRYLFFYILIQHGRSTTFEIILEFGSTEALGSTGSDVLCRAVWHGLVSNDALIMCQSEMNSNLAQRFWARWHGPPFWMHFKQIGNFRTTFETVSTPLPYFWQTQFIWIRHGSSATFETGLRF